MQAACQVCAQEYENSRCVIYIEMKTRLAWCNTLEELQIHEVDGFMIKNTIGAKRDNVL